MAHHTKNISVFVSIMETGTRAHVSIRRPSRGRNSAYNCTAESVSRLRVVFKSMEADGLEVGYSAGAASEGKPEIWTVGVWDFRRWCNG